MNQYFIPFYGWMIFHCMATPHVQGPFLPGPKMVLGWRLGKSAPLFFALCPLGSVTRENAAGAWAPRETANLIMSSSLCNLSLKSHQWWWQHQMQLVWTVPGGRSCFRVHSFLWSGTSAESRKGWGPSLVAQWGRLLVWRGVHGLRTGLLNC